MLMPIIAAIGSFWVSERILKPKTAALFILACLAIYDIFISPPIPIIVRHHRGDAIVDEIIDSSSSNNDNNDTLYSATSNNYQYRQEEDDLATSLRCYRGPLLLSVTLFCVAWSLRIWRRGGCACDELLFLPGTPHEFAIIRKSSSAHGGRNMGGDGSSEEDIHMEMMSLTSNNTMEQQQQQQQQRTNISIPIRKSPSTPTSLQQKSLSSPRIETCFSEGDAAAGGSGCSSGGLHTNNSDANNQQQQLSPLIATTPDEDNTNNNNDVIISSSLSDSPLGYIRERAWSGLNMLVVTENLGVPPPPPALPDLSCNDNDDNGGELEYGNNSGDELDSDGNDQMRRKSSLGSSSNRNSDNSNNMEKEIYDVDYAPSGPSVLGAALDLTLPVLFNFHMFVVLMKDHYKKEAAGVEVAAVDGDTSSSTTVPVNDSDDAFGGAFQLFTPPEIPPKVLPLIFLSGAIVRTQLPRRQRSRFYKIIIQGTILAPFKPVRFRDAFIGDFVTSLVRPIVDIVFTATYYGAAVYGFFSRKYDLNETGYIVSESSLLHGIVLPLVAISPLWMRFLQTLRQAYDSGKRWPYLGNAFKYFTAGLVVLYGMTHAAGERGIWWILSFTAATIYQIVWDSCIDWELLVVVRNDAWETKDSSSPTLSSTFWRCPTFISSLNPRFFPTTFLMYIVQPFRRRVSQPLRRLYDLMPKRLDQIRLRPKRLFDDDKFYWKALIANAALRFCWMMGFIPAYRVSIMDGSTQETFADKFNGWSFVILGALEIFRRSIWGIIKVELETIKLTSGGENDLTMASTADEYLREGKWNAWRRSGANNADNEEAEDGSEEEEDSQIIWLNPSGDKDHQSPATRRSQTESSIFKNSSRNERHQWLGITVSANFIRAAYKVELLLWPIAFLVLSYIVILAE